MHLEMNSISMLTNSKLRPLSKNFLEQNIILFSKSTKIHNQNFKKFEISKSKIQLKLRLKLHPTLPIKTLSNFISNYLITPRSLPLPPTFFHLLSSPLSSSPPAPFFAASFCLHPLSTSQTLIRPRTSLHSSRPEQASG